MQPNDIAPDKGNSGLKKIAIPVAAAVIIAGGLYLANAAYQKGTGNVKDNNPNAIAKDNGLKIEILEEGEGALAKSGDNLSVHYLGMLENGDKFDSSVDRGMPFNFQLGSGSVIKGWDEGLLGMKIGEKRRLTIPPDLAYGSDVPPGGPIPPGATLIFEVELIKIEKQSLK